MEVVEWAVAERPLPGQDASGDVSVVEPFSGGTLVAVIDGLGHGVDAAATSRLAAATLRAHPDQPIPTLIRLCHERLRGARGAVMSAAAFDARNNTMTWAGIGNVEGILLRAGANAWPRREALVPRNGVVGFQMRDVRANVLSIAPRDVLLLATDGIASGFLDAYEPGPPQQVADRILARFGKPTDDALVLVAVYTGAAS